MFLVMGKCRSKAARVAPVEAFKNDHCNSRSAVKVKAGKRRDLGRFGKGLEDGKGEEFLVRLSTN